MTSRNNGIGSIRRQVKTRLDRRKIGLKTSICS